MKVMGIDPGYERMGIAVIEKKNGGREELIFSDCLRTSAKENFPDRLKSLGQELERLLDIHKPDLFALESLFFEQNTKTALKVSEAKGVAIYVARTRDVNVIEYTPSQIKTAITGYGKATKRDIMFMIPKLISYDTAKKIDDEVDAVAVALTALAIERF